MSQPKPNRSTRRVATLKTSGGRRIGFFAQPEHQAAIERSGRSAQAAIAQALLTAYPPDER